MRVRLNFYLLFVYRSPSTDDSVYDCILESMGSIQSQDRKSAGTIASYFGSCVLMYSTGSWLNSSSCFFPELFMSAVPDLCKVRVSCPIGRSNHSHVGILLESA